MLTPTPKQASILEQAEKSVVDPSGKVPTPHVTAQVCGDRMFVTAHCINDAVALWVLAKWAVLFLTNDGLSLSQETHQIHIIFNLNEH